MEMEGVSIDAKLLNSLSKKCDLKIGKLQTKIFNIAGEEFNLNSPKQLGNWP